MSLSHNVTFNTDDVLRLCEERLSKITTDNWKTRCKHIEKIESDYFEKKAIVGNTTENIIIINIGDDLIS